MKNFLVFLLLFPSLVLGSPITQTPTGSFFNTDSPPADINRLNDRLLVGGATVNDGNFPPITGDWNQGYTTYAQAAFSSTNGGIAIQGSTRTSDNNTGTQFPTYAISGKALNDDTSYQQLATAGFFTAVRKAGAGTAYGTVGIEVDVQDEGTAINPNPYWGHNGNGYSPAYVAGVGINPSGKAASNAMSVIAGGTTGQVFNKGIIFGRDALAGSDGYTGTSEAISLAKGQAINLYESSSAVGMTIRSDQTIGDAMTHIISANGIIDTSKLNHEGTKTNDNAPAGYVGEDFEVDLPIGSAVGLTSGVAANVVSKLVPAGDYEVSCNVGFAPNANTTSNFYVVGINTTSATIPANNGSLNAITGIPFGVGSAPILPCGTIRENFATATNIYVVTKSVFAVSTNAAYGHLHIRRIR